MYNPATRSITISEMYFRRPIDIKNSPDQLPAQEVMLEISSPVPDNISLGTPTPDLSKNVFVAPTIWQQVSIHLTRYWPFYVVGIGAIAFLYFSKDDEPYENEK